MKDKFDKKHTLPKSELIDKNGNEHMPYQRIIEGPIAQDFVEQHKISDDPITYKFKTEELARDFMSEHVEPLSPGEQGAAAGRKLRELMFELIRLGVTPDSFVETMFKLRAMRKFCENRDDSIKTQRDREKELRRSL